MKGNLIYSPLCKLVAGIFLLFITTGCGKTLKLEKVDYTSTMETSSAVLHFRLEDRNLLLAFKNKLEYDMNNVVIVVEQFTKNITETQSILGTIEPDVFYTITTPIIYNSNGKINIKYYYSYTSLNSEDVYEDDIFQLDFKFK